MKVRVRQSIQGQKEKVAIMDKTAAMEARLKYQFQLLLRSVRMVDIDGRDRKFKLVENGSVIGYFYIEDI